MEDSSLNQAHYETRRAEQLVRQGKLDDAIECHEKASTLLSSAMTLSDLTTVKQSLLCQKEYHIRQVWLLQSKIAQLEKYKKKMNSSGGKIGSVSCSVESQQETQQQLKVTQMEILRTLSEADAALHLHADTCTSMDPHLNQVIECLQKMRQQLEQLFQFSRESDTTTDLQLEAIEPIDEFAQSSQSISPETEKGSNDLETELPALAPLEVPHFDFSMLPM
ncbi:nuclear receptor-binding factor 2-like [Daphnia carinata]|uniref:nuclear receptor-binding factor 2-like n=1 Tax=Daphnia carinata TaxID=120202 RepID=UPI00257ED60D|nr:nuclear receptor-binding factor 2-like [Daphnia carinata]